MRADYRDLEQHVLNPSDSCQCSDARYNWGAPGETHRISDYAQLNQTASPGEFDLGQIPCLKIEGKLLLDLGTFFFGINDIIMGRGASIEVVPGTVRFIISSSHVHGCEYLWKGIDVPKNAAIAILPNTIIEDAEIAIRSRQRSVYSGFSATYNNNYISHQIEGYVRPGPGVQTTGPVDNIYKNDRDLLPHYNGHPNFRKSLVAMKLVDARFWVIGTTQFDFPSNQFIGLPGIHADRSIFWSGHNSFKDIVHTNWALGNRDRAIDIRDGIISGVYDADFEDCSREIRTVGSKIFVNRCNFIQNTHGVRNSPASIEILSGVNTKTSIKNSNFDVFQMCVHTTSSTPQLRTFEFDKNEINSKGSYNVVDIGGSSPRSFGEAHIVDNHVYRANPTTQAAFVRASGKDWIISNNYSELGVSLVGMDATSVSDNEFDRNNPDAFHSSSIFLSNSFDVRLSCNTLDNGRDGFTGSGMNFGTLLLGNQLKNHQTSLVVRPNSFIGPQIHGGNRWTASHNVDARCFGDVRLSEFVTDPSIMPDNVVPTTDWFVPESGPTYACLAFPDEDDVSWRTDLSLMDEMILEDVFLDYAYGDQVQWSGDLRLYEKVKRYPLLLLQDGISAFMAAQEGTEIDHIQRIKAGIEADLDPGANGTQLEGIRSSLEQDQDEYLTLYNDLITASESEAPAIRAAMYAIGTNSEPTWQAYVNLDAQIKSDRALALSKRLDELLGLEMTSAMGEAWKEVTMYALQHLLGQGFSPEDSAALYALASRCPMMYGRAVLTARTLYDDVHHTDIAWEANEHCSDEQARRGVSGDATNGLRLFPNPTTDLVNITWPETASYDVITLYDLTGLPLVTDSLSNASSAYQLSIAHLPAGTYVIELSGRDGSITKVCTKR